jgi:hypothetical protein
VYRERSLGRVPSEFGKEAIQTRDYCVAKNATHRADRPDPSLRKERMLGMTSKMGVACNENPLAVTILREF